VSRRGTIFTAGSISLSGHGAAASNTTALYLNASSLRTIGANVKEAVMNEDMIQHYRGILEGVGENPGREGLVDTPKRAAKAMQYLCQGYGQTVEQVVNGALFESDNDEMVIVRDIELYSMCEHHMLPFIGKAHVAYIPTGKVLGLSKVARIVDMFARRLQIQENMTKQIADAIMQVTNAAGVAVVIEAQHMCMMMRGCEKQNSVMTTSVMLGEFRDSYNTRQEFLQLIRGR
jgi:GTP cyclohydrolase IA